MMLREVLKKRREEILCIARKHGATRIQIIGSVARGEERPESDVDFLVDMESGRSLLDHAALTLELQQTLGKKVDIATTQGLRERVRNKILKEAIPL